MYAFDLDTIERARAVNLISLAQHYGAKLSRRGAEYVGPCPRCGGDDRFAIHPAKSFFNCRGCKRGGHGAVDLQMFLADCDFATAIKRLTNTLLPVGKPVGGNQPQHRERDSAEAEKQ